MLIGIYGPHAVGKTTFLLNYLDAFGDAACGPIHIVRADDAIVYQLSDDGMDWLEHKQKAWKADKASKLPLMEEAMFDHRPWVVESARFFGGCGPQMVEYLKAGGHIKFIIPVVEPHQLRAFIQHRCDSNGQEFNATYWDEARLRYECHDRYVNFVNKIMRPAGVECSVWMVDDERTVWADIFNQIVRWL